MEQVSKSLRLHHEPVVSVLSFAKSACVIRGDSRGGLPAQLPNSRNFTCQERPPLLYFRAKMERGMLRMVDKRLPTVTSSLGGSRKGSPVASGRVMKVTFSSTLLATYDQCFVSGECGSTSTGNWTPCPLSCRPDSDHLHFLHCSRLRGSTPPATGRWRLRAPPKKPCWCSMVNGYPYRASKRLKKA